MKKFFAFMVSSLLIIDISVFASTFHIAVPKKLVEQNATLLVYMVDSQGNQSVGTCRLNSEVDSQVILQNQLEITSCANAALMQTSMDLLQNSSIVEPQSVVVCFELDSEKRLLRVLVVEGDFFAPNPFDVVEMPFESFVFHQVVEKEDGEDDPDGFSSLAKRLSEQSSDDQINRKNIEGAWFDQYMAYAKIFVLMQYGKAQRAVRDMSVWWT